EPDLVRSIEALRHTSVKVMLLDAEGSVLLQNPAASRAFGPAAPFADRVEDAALAAELLAGAAAGEVVEREAPARHEHRPALACHRGAPPARSGDRADRHSRAHDG
ncbi:MAG: hypothetical protein IT372_22405, partial [Polyangiaceae bacterium]|nr:hypothetical protein [Polyangiaceae bacterium]